VVLGFPGIFGIGTQLESLSSLAPVPTPAPVSIKELGSAGGIHWGTASVANAESFDLGTGPQHYSMAGLDSGYFYAAQANLPPELPTSETVLFAKVTGTSPCYDLPEPKFFEGVTPEELVDLSSLNYKAVHSVQFFLPNSHCHAGRFLAFRQDGRYGIIEPMDVTGVGRVHFNWWYAEAGVTDFVSAIESASTPSE